MTQNYNIATKNMQDGVLKVDGEDFFSIHIIESKPSLSYDLDKMECEIKIKLKTIRTEARYDKGKVSFMLSDEEIKRLKWAIDLRMKAIFDFGLQNNIDILNIKDGFSKKFPKKTSQILAEDFLNKINLNVDVVITQVD